MPAVTVRNLPEETHRALKARAAKNGRTTEAEIREILEEAVLPAKRLRIGSELAALGLKLGCDELNTERDETPAEFPIFE